MNAIAYKNQDGSISFIIPAVTADVPAGAESITLNADQIPDMYFWKAFRIDGGNLTVDIQAAKNVRLDTFREIRKEKLEKLDIEAIKSLEAGDAVKLAYISSKKQALRDVTTLPLPDTLEEIKATLPAILA